ncbi:MAG: hypothetical protein R2712_01995 [Vicinamibacterales bacterium]
MGAPIGAAAQDVRPFDGAGPFGVLAGVSVTVSGAPTLAGDVGVDAGGTVTGPSCRRCCPQAAPCTPATPLRPASAP